MILVVFLFVFAIYLDLAASASSGTLAGYESLGFGLLVDALERLCNSGVVNTRYVCTCMAWRFLYDICHDLRPWIKSNWT